MVPQDLVLNTICRQSPAVFDELKHILLLGYLSFSILDEEKVTANILAEKACDYFTMVELRTGKSFERLLTSYLNDLDSIVGGRIAKTPPAQKGEKDPPQVPRARRYYEKALQIKNQKQPLTLEQLVDYSRVMLCLYCAVIQKEGESVEDFNFSSSCLEPEALLMAMNKEEITSLFSPAKKKRFNLSDPYGMDTFTLFLTILMIYTIIDRRLEEESENLQVNPENFDPELEDLDELDDFDDLEDLDDLEEMEDFDDLEDLDDLDELRDMEGPQEASQAEEAEGSHKIEPGQEDPAQRNESLEDSNEGKEDKEESKRREGL